jgi:glycosyltransferase involved in cell wall biosynthesis
MRIALVARSINPLAPNADPASGAEATRVTSLAQALAGLGHRVTIYARRDSRGLPDSTIIAPGVTVEHVTAGPPESLDADRLAPHLPEFGHYLAQHWRRNPPGIAHAYHWTAGLAALAGARDLGVPVAQTFGSLGTAEQRHGAEEGVSDTRLRLEACIARSADVVLASSAEELADLARLGVARGRATVVPCGVDTQQFTPEGPAAERSRRPRLLAAQPLTATRSLGIALRALADIPEAELVIAGGPRQKKLGHDKDYREVLRLARKLKVHDRLVCTGLVAPDDLPALLRSADLLVSMAPYEPVGMTALQAMACGTPVVAAAAGAERDAVVDKTTGLILPPGPPAQLALRVRRLLANSLRLEAYGIAATDRARSRYSWERIGRETLAAYGRCSPRAAAAVRARSAQPDHAGAREAVRVPAGAPA